MATASTIASPPAIVESSPSQDSADHREGRRVEQRHDEHAAGPRIFHRSRRNQASAKSTSRRAERVRDRDRVEAVARLASRRGIRGLVVKGLGRRRRELDGERLELVALRCVDDPAFERDVDEAVQHSVTTFVRSMFAWITNMAFHRRH